MKKVLSIVLSIAMVLCMMPAMAFAGTATASQAAAAYSDTEGLACEGAVNVLSALGVVDGYTDGTYKPEQVVTRAEMAKLIVTALGVDKYATATTSKFTDMGAASWAIPYVEYASNLNIVNGYGYGLFGPNDTVTYEQAVTMIVRALGYTDACKEMNGSWPAIYVQKATALGLFENVVNGGANGADRGDVAIMLYNALDAAEVYADADGATQYKTGNNTTTFAGNIVNGVTMMGTLNLKGSTSYGVVTKSDADDALTDVYSLIGAAGKKVYNKDNKLISVGEIASSFLVGEYNANTNKFTADGTEYSFADGNINSRLIDGKTYTKNPDDGVNYAAVPYFWNSAAQNPDKNIAGVVAALGGATTTDMTLAVKISGKTITNVYSIQVWEAGAAAKVSAGQIAKINSNQSLLGWDFPLNDDNEIDTNAFVLEGVDSLDQIAEDNIVAVYPTTSSQTTAKIAKVTVGTQTVEGKVTSVKSNASSTKVEYTIDGKVYKASDLPNSDIAGKAAGTEILSVSDEVILYLDVDGKIYTSDATESGVNYAVVLATTTSAGDFSSDTKVKLFTAEGSDTTLSCKSGVSVAGLAAGDLVAYKVNSEGKITDITETTTSWAKAGTTTTTKSMNNGVIDGKLTTDNMVVFVYDGGTKSKKDSYKAETASALTDDIAASTPYFATKKDYIAAILVGESATNSNSSYGVVNSKTKTQNSKDDDVYSIDAIIDGVKVTGALTKDQTATYNSAKAALNLVSYSGSEIKSIEAVNPQPKASVLGDTAFEAMQSGDKQKVAMFQNAAAGTSTFGSYSAYIVKSASNNRIELSNGAYETIKDAKVYVANLNADKNALGNWTEGEVADITVNGYVVLFQTNKKSDNWDTVLYIPESVQKDFSAVSIGAPLVSVTQSANGKSLTANATAVNGGTLSYQWYQGSVDPANKVTGATNSTFVLPAKKLDGSTNVAVGDTYVIVVTETNGSTVISAEESKVLDAVPSEVSASASVTSIVASAGGSSTITATAKDQFGAVIAAPMITYSIPTTEKVVINSTTGELTVTAGAATGTITVTATCGNATDTVDVTLE